MTKKSKLKSSAAGFTLIEIVIAVALLAVALTTLLGLQSAIVGNTLTSRDQMQATLIARSVLSGIEMKDAIADEKGGSFSVEDAYRDYGIPYPESEAERATLQRFHVDMQVAPWKVAEDESGMNKLELTVSWGDSHQQRVNFIYFAPTPDEGDDEK